MVEKDDVRRGYDGVAEAYAAERGFDGQEQAVFEQFCDSLPTTACVLDAGCGQGRPILSRLVTETDRISVGVDLSGEQLQLALQNAPDALLAQGDMTRLPLADATLDGVIAFHSLIHIPEAEHQQAISEFARVLRPEGYLLVSEGIGEWEGTNPDWLDTGVEMQWHIAGADATRQQLHEAGFRIEREWEASDNLGDASGTWTFFLAQLD